MLRHHCLSIHLASYHFVPVRCIHGRVYHFANPQNRSDGAVNGRKACWYKCGDTCGFQNIPVDCGIELYKTCSSRSNEIQRELSH